MECNDLLEFFFCLLFFLTRTDYRYTLDTGEIDILRHGDIGSGDGCHVRMGWFAIEQCDCGEGLTCFPERSHVLCF